MEWLTPILSGLGASAATIVGAYFVFRGKRVEQEVAEAEVEATAADAFLKGQTAFQAYVDGVVEKGVTAAVADLKQQLADMERTVGTMRTESHEMNDAIRSRETQLWLWNIRNRPGPMPELPEPILNRLGIRHLSSLGDIEDTQPTNPT